MAETEAPANRLNVVAYYHLKLGNYPLVSRSTDV